LSSVRAVLQSIAAISNIFRIVSASALLHRMGIGLFDRFNSYTEFDDAH
jgi:hypothetical protein